MRTMRMGFLAAAMAAIGLGASAAKATSVTYSTTGVFGSSGTSTATDGLVFIGITSSTVTAPSTISLGDIDDFGVTGTLTDTFVLTVSQSVPLPGGGSAFGTGTVAGVLTVNSSSATIQFASPLTITVASNPAVSYTIANAGLVELVAPDTNGGNTSIQGNVVAAPLPSAAWMGGASLLALGVMSAVRRRALLA